VTMAEKTTKKGKAAPVKKEVKPATDLQGVRSAAAKKPAKATTPAAVKPAKDLQALRSVAAKKAVTPTVKKKVQPTKVEPEKAKLSGKGKGPRKLGFNIPLPTSEPEEYDANCPFFGKITVRGRILKGTVVSAKMHRTIAVLINRKHYVQKYERYEKRRTKLLVHNPPSVNAQVGDNVRIMETRPISKTKHFVVVERIPKKIQVVTVTEEKKE